MAEDISRVITSEDKANIARLEEPRTRKNMIDKELRMLNYDPLSLKSGEANEILLGYAIRQKFEKLYRHQF